MGESVEKSEQGKLLGALLWGLTCGSDSVNLAVGRLNASVKGRVRFHSTLVQREKVHPCFVSLGCIALLMAVANLAVELIDGVPGIPMLEYGLMVELSSGHHRASESNTF